MNQGKADFFHSEDDWAAVPVPGSGTMMLLPSNWTDRSHSEDEGDMDGPTARSDQVGCPWCGFFTSRDAVCDRCGSPLPAERSTFWSLLDAAS